jgi:hypothetical protein
MGARWIATGEFVGAVREPLRPVLLRDGQEVFQEQVLPHQPTQIVNLPVGGVLRPDDARMMAAEVDPFQQRQFRVVGQRLDMERPIEHRRQVAFRIAAIHRLADDVQPPLPQHRTAMLRV